MLQMIILTAGAALKSRKGVTALEYGILAAAIIGAIATIVGTIGTDLTALFTNLATYLTAPPAAK